WRQRHENGLRATAGLQPEQRAAIVDEVEFDVAATAVELERAFALTVGRVLAAGDDGGIGVGKCCADVTDECEAAIKARFVEIIEKQPADAAAFVAVAQVKIIVTPRLEAWVDVIPIGGAGGVRGLVPGDGVRAKAVAGGQVETAAKPPY